MAMIDTGIESDRSGGLIAALLVGIVTGLAGFVAALGAGTGFLSGLLAYSVAGACGMAFVVTLMAVRR